MGVIIAVLPGLLQASPHIQNRTTPSRWLVLFTSSLLLFLSSSTCLMKVGSLCRPTAGRKSEWAGWKQTHGPDETARWCFSQSPIREEQVHMTAGGWGRPRREITGTCFKRLYFFTPHLSQDLVASNAYCQVYRTPHREGR